MPSNEFINLAFTFLLEITTCHYEKCHLFTKQIVDIPNRLIRESKNIPPLEIP